MSDIQHLDKGLSHWNGHRWVSAKEREIALRIIAYCDYAELPWYKKLITRKPR